MWIRSIFFRLMHWEQWQSDVKYVPLFPFWLWYCLRCGSMWFFSASNPVLNFGGWDGASKREMYERLPQAYYPRSIYIQQGSSFSSVEAQLHAFSFPVAVKPEYGLMGLLFRKLDSRAQLEAYHRHMPVDYIIQELVTDPLEVSIFYYRFPGTANGRITGFVLKEGLEVQGDGSSSLDQLLQQLVGRPGFKLNEWRLKYRDRLQEVFVRGEIFRLAWVANLSRGGRLVSLEKEKDEQLLRLFDSISQQASFYYGRYDIKCRSIDALKNGVFTILEFNGAGAEPHHIYGNSNHILQAYRIVLHHWNAMAKIARMHHRLGVAYCPTWSGLARIRHGKKNLKLLKMLDKEMPV